MFDKQKLRQLQQRSHTRGLLSKEFYHNEQLALEQKRKAMKEQLDRQVQERRRQKQAEKLAQQRKMRQEQEDIKNYYRNLQNREKKYSSNQSMKQSRTPYQTYPNEQDSRAHPQQQQRNRGSSKPYLLANGDIPLLPVMPPDNTAPTAFHNSPPQGVLSNSKSKVNFVGSGAIPLLDLSEEQAHPPLGAKTKKGRKTKRQKTLESQFSQQHQALKEPQVEKVQMSRYNQPVVHERQKSIHQQQRKSTLPDEQSIMGSIVRNRNSLEKREFDEGSLKQIEEVENENNSLRVQLKKNQEAISLLMGAVRSNGKLQKFRVQAEKILTGNNMQASMASRKQEEKKEEGLMLPRINMRNQSIMHDYLLAAARRAKKSVGK